jgi:hypothetical protein
VLSLRFTNRPSLAYFIRNGERAGQAIGFQIRELKPQKTYTKTFRFQHPARAFKRFFRTEAVVVNSCGHIDRVAVTRLED